MKNKLLVALFLLNAGMDIAAQTVNTGEVTVTEGTIFSTVSEFNNTPTGSFINHGDVYVYSHWNNDGMVDFLADGGLTRFIGVFPQALTGSSISYFYDTLFDNPAAQPAFELSGGVSVANESEFYLGIVDNDTYGGSFQFEQFADHISTTDDSHVDGPVIKIGDAFFNYPKGDGGFYRYAEISAPDDSVDIFTGKYFFENTDANYPVNNLGPNLTLIDNAEHWTIERTSGGSDVLVTLSWRDVTTPNEIMVAPFDAIHIARWDDALQLWVDEGGVVDTANQIVTTAVNDYGVFTLARVKEENVLPCALTIYNLITPNGDGYNDFFKIEQAVDDLNCAGNMKVTIFNRWGVKVFEAENYDNVTNVFDGHSQGRATIAKNKKLPTGTYFYILTFDYQENGSAQRFKKAGYIYVNGE